MRENAIDVVYRPVATDPQNDPIAYGPIGGIDAARFTMNPVTREVRFAVQPDFGQPDDADLNNVYNISFTASDGANTTTQNVAITVTDVQPGFRLRRVTPATFEHVYGYPDSSGRIVLVESRGRMRLMDPLVGEPSWTPMIDITASPVADPNGLNFRSVAFSPNFFTDRTLYVWSWRSTTQTAEVWKYRMSTTNPDRVDEASRDVILSVPMPIAVNQGGLLVFNTSGQLIVGIGSGDGNANEERAQDPNSYYGKLLRIDPSSDAFPVDPDKDYAIPAGNPFAAGGGLPEIYAMGVARPNWGSIDARTGSLFFTDRGIFPIIPGFVGFQEINHAGATTGAPSAPLNFGWPWRIGGQANPNYPPTSPMNEPEAAYDQSVGQDIFSGIAYRGPIEDLQSDYFFGDSLGEKIWSIPTPRLTGGGTDDTTFFVNFGFLAPPGPIGRPFGIFSDTQGNLYISGTNGLFVVEPNP